MSNPTAKTVSIGQLITGKVAAIPGAGCAVFDLVPEFDLHQVNELKIIIAPQSFSRGNSGAASRETPDAVIKINIAVMKKCGSKADIPDLLLLTEQIATGIERKTVSDSDSTGLVIAVEFDPLYDADAFMSTKVFIAVCTTTVKVIR